jgi:hypothetical protein
MVPAPAPEVSRRGVKHRRMGPPGDGDDSSQASHRILRRQNHLPAGKARRLGMTYQELAEIRAIKELLVEKGIISREEIDEQKAKIASRQQPE